MQIRSIKPIPKSVAKAWGVEGVAAIECLIAALVDRRFSGPLTWKQVTSIPFALDVSQSVRVIVSLSRCGGIAPWSLFDGVATVWSKTIHDKTVISDPWHPIGEGYDTWHTGYVPCLAYRLSHLKWAQHPGTENPAWLMTDQAGYGSNIDNWLTDFDALILPKLGQLVTDPGLAAALVAAIAYVRPPWVKSDGPKFVHIRQLLAALSRPD